MASPPLGPRPRPLALTAGPRPRPSRAPSRALSQGYKVAFFKDKAHAKGPLGGSLYETPMDLVFYLSIVNNVFAILGLAGVLNAQKELVTAFFAYNAVQTVISFHMFVDVCITARIVFPSETATAGLSTYEKGAAAFVFFNFLLSIAATVFAVKAVDEIRTKQREDFTSISVLSGDL